jgi:hypothetical protein
LGTEARAFRNSCQIFRASRSNPKRLFAIKGDSDGAPSPSLCSCAGNQKPRSPRSGASLFSFPLTPTSPRWGEGEVRRGGGSTLPPLPLGRGRPRSGRVRGRLCSLTGHYLPLTPTLSPTGRGRSGNPTPGGGLFQQRTCLPSNAPPPVAGPDSCVSVRSPGTAPGLLFCAARLVP